MTVAVLDLSGKLGSQLQLWDATSGKPIGQPLVTGTLSHDAGSDFGHLSVSPNDTYVATADYNDDPNVARIWNLLDGKQVGKPIG